MCTHSVYQVFTVMARVQHQVFWCAGVLVLCAHTHTHMHNTCMSVCGSHYSCGVRVRACNFGGNFETAEGTRWRCWLRHCAANQKVADSIGIFH